MEGGLLVMNQRERSRIGESSIYNLFPRGYHQQCESIRGHF